MGLPMKDHQPYTLAQLRRELVVDQRVNACALSVHSPYPLLVLIGFRRLQIRLTRVPAGRTRAATCQSPGREKRGRSLQRRRTGLSLRPPSLRPLRDHRGDPSLRSDRSSNRRRLPSDQLPRSPERSRTARCSSDLRRTVCHPAPAGYSHMPLAELHTSSVHSFWSSQSASIWHSGVVASSLHPTTGIAPNASTQMNPYT